eukprot:25366-Eustigmatos_ZCMA.PRE.1
MSTQWYRSNRCRVICGDSSVNVRDYPALRMLVTVTLASRLTHTRSHNIERNDVLPASRITSLF